MDRRLLCLYFPCLALDRFEREDPARRLRPFAVTQEVEGHCRILAMNSLASRADIRPGTRLSDARTFLPSLEVVPDDPKANAQIKQHLIEWCNRYSPLVGDDGFGGIALDITGCAHLFGGEAALLEDLQLRIRRTGYRVRGAIAGTLGVAWALARYGKRFIVTSEEMPRVLEPLPVTALRLPDEVTQQLCRLGLVTIAALQKIPSQSLTTRYGPIVSLRLDQALGHTEEPIVPHIPPPPYRAMRTLAEPIATVSAVQHILLDLLKEICSRLEKDHIGARQVNLDCYRVDGTVAKCCVCTSKPVRSIAHLMGLFLEKLETLDAGFGIDALVLSVPAIEKADPVQLALPRCDSETDVEEEETFDSLIDRLGMRLGFQNVCRLRICESPLPEYAIEFRPVTAPVISSAVWPPDRIRPVRFIEPPMRIEVSTIFPEKSPVQFRVGNRLHRIVRAEGPERLTPEWWRDGTVSWEMRDYYRIEDDQGARFWIFREIKSGSHCSSPVHWFLCGHLP